MPCASIVASGSNTALATTYDGTLHVPRYGLNVSVSAETSMVSVPPVRTGRGWVDGVAPPKPARASVGDPVPALHAPTSAASAAAAPTVFTSSPTRAIRTPNSPSTQARAASPRRLPSTRQTDHSSEGV